MSNFYTTVSHENNLYVGRVYSANNNQVVYTTKGYILQEQAAKDARTYIIKGTVSSSANDSDTPVNIPNVINSTASYTTPKFDPGRRCCGR